MDRIQFTSSTETAGFFSPLAGMEYAEQTIEVRRDPLTGMTAVTSSELTSKEAIFGTTDWPHAQQIAAKSREGCFFCPERVMEATPRYPEEMVPGGRLAWGRALVFPNLFPLAALHAIVTYPDLHFVRPSEFTPDLLEEGIGAAVEFCGRAERHIEGLEHLQLCCNHMPPAGASLVHAHFQVFGGGATPWMVRSTWECSAAFRRTHGVGYWPTLVAEETARGDRFIESRDGCTWLTPFAPGGGREVMAVFPDFARVSALGAPQVAALARGLAKVLAWYEGEGLSSFNFTLSGGPLDPSSADHAVVLRVIARAAFKPDYRADDDFLQKQLGGEVIFEAPEKMAAFLRREFAG